MNNLEGKSPEKIAEILFSNKPKAPCSHQILAYASNNEGLICIFEILVTILLEGINVLTSHHGGIKGIDLQQFTVNHLTEMKPWFNSIGFDINVKTHSLSNKNKWKHYFCDIIVNNGKGREILKNKNINKDYHFFINPANFIESKKKKNLKELSCVFVNDNDVYEISFDNFYL